ncbi:MAG: hypothetical protein E4H23_12320 [Chrysiogenales bacterium]|nr:MAG: hypothetical protein E4H23_12320 [Chrysiogenales bacterium]
MKEKFMENMMDKMSFGEKKEMMNDMMEKFFAGMTEDEKKELMKEMMGKMMGGGGADGKMANPMMAMMGMMMGNKHKKGDFNPMDMCKKMMAGMGPNRNTESFTTPEIQILFEEWARQMDSEVLGLIESAKEMKIDDMAAQLKISRDSLILFLNRLARQGKIDLKPTAK